jgi:hypothetical protein
MEVQLHSYPQRQMGMSVHYHAPAALPRGKRSDYPLHKKLVDLSASCDALDKLPLSGIEPQFLGHPVRSLVLHDSMST